jgi:thiol-disulfide isomerase/thioredoxin
MKKIGIKKVLIFGIFLLLITQSMLVIGTNQQNDPVNLGSEYEGHLRIYIVEIDSRWTMENGAPYEYALFDFAFDNTIEIPYLDTYEDTITWQGDIEEDNVLILAAIFNPKPHQKYADPPLGRPFDAFYVDASAGVHPGETESSVKNEEFTHTVLCEVGTASWCPSCPGMANTLKSIYRQGEYPFYFVEMVTDMSEDANNRMSDYNLKYLPSAFYDGGNQLIIGGAASASDHKDVIEDAGKRDVHDLDFTLSAEWIEEGTIDIGINITNNEELPNSPPVKPTVTGSEQGKPGEIQEFQITTTDPDEDEVYYKIDWADGEITDWLGPYNSGETITVEHQWEETGNFIVKVKAKDPDNAETEWTWLKVTMPKNKLVGFWLQDFLQHHPQLFPLFRQLIL